MLRFSVLRNPTNLLLAFLCLPVTFLTTGCANESVAIGKSVGMLVSRSDPTELSPLRPDLRYLRASIDGRTALLVLGFVEADPGGDIEVWYSAEREVLKIQRGHIVGSAGLATDWRDVRIVSPMPGNFPVPQQAMTNYTRERDEMPGYRFGIRETITVQPIAAPRETALKNLIPSSLQWIEETAEPSNSGSEPLPPARYAFEVRDGIATVIYSEQCLTASLCLALQRWPTSASGAQ